MNKKHFIGLSVILFLLSGSAFCQNPENGTSDDFLKLQLPPLAVLYENAQNNPSIKLLENQKNIQERLLKKEKRTWLSFFSLKAGYAYGKTDYYGSISDITTPIFHQYTGVDQHYYNAGGNINIPLETLFDLRGKSKRQRLAIKNAELEKDIAFQSLKREIATFYSRITSNIASLKVAAEAVAVAQADYVLKEKDFQTGNGNSSSMVVAKRQHIELMQMYESIRSQLISDIYELEIISNTPIISK